MYSSHLSAFDYDVCVTRDTQHRQSIGGATSNNERRRVVLSSRRLDFEELAKDLVEVARGGSLTAVYSSATDQKGEK
jgi:hypothetical protein